MQPHFIKKKKDYQGILGQERLIESISHLIGFNPNIGSPFLFRECWKFNLLTEKWTKVFTADTDNMPEELVSNALEIRSDVLLVFGGTGYQFGDKRSNRCSILHPYASPRYIDSIETSGNAPDPQYGQAMAVLGKYLYVIGGTTGYEYTCDIYR